MAKLIKEITDIKEYLDPNTLVIFVSETPIPNKKGKDCSFIEYLCKNRFNLYKIKSNIKQNYIITVDKTKLTDEDLTYIDTIMEYRDSMFSFDGIDMFDILKKYTNSAWDKYISLIWKEFHRLQDYFGGSYDKIPKEIKVDFNRICLFKQIFFDGIGVKETYHPIVHSIKPNENKHIARLIIEDVIFPILKKESELETYMGCSVRYSFFENLFTPGHYIDYNKIKDIRDKFYFKNNINGTKWVNEWNLYKYVKAIYKNTISQYSPDFLERQRYDVYIPDLNVAIEYQGLQHYEQTDYFGSLEEIQKRDKRKKELSDKNGVDIIYWKYDFEVSEKNVRKVLNDYIKNKEN